MQCPQCQGKGFIEYEHGLIQVACDECEGTGEIIGEKDPRLTKTEPDKPKALILSGRMCKEGETFEELESKARQLIEASSITTKEEGNNMADVMLSRINHMPSPEPLSKEDLEALAKDTHIPPEAVESIEMPKELKEALNDSLTRIESDNQPSGSANTGKSRKPQKQKAGKKVTKRAR